MISLLRLSFGWPTIAVDTHIDRVSNRTKFVMGKNVVEVEQKLLKVVPAEFKVGVPLVKSSRSLYLRCSKTKVWRLYY